MTNRSCSFEYLPLLVPIITARELPPLKLYQSSADKTFFTKPNCNTSQILTDRYPLSSYQKSSQQKVSASTTLISTKEVLNKRNFYHHTSIYKIDEYKGLTKLQFHEQNGSNLQIDEDLRQTPRPFLEDSSRKVLVSDFKRKVTQYLLTIKYKNESANKNFHKFYSNLKTKTQGLESSLQGSSLIQASQPNLSQITWANNSQVQDSINRNRFNHNSVFNQDFGVKIKVFENGNQTSPYVSHKALQSRLLQKLEPFLNNEKIDYDAKMFILMLQYEEIVDKIYSDAYHITIPKNYQINPSDYNEFYSVDPTLRRYNNDFTFKFVEHIIGQVKLPTPEEIMSLLIPPTVIEELQIMPDAEPIDPKPETPQLDDENSDESELDEHGKKTGRRSRKRKAPVILDLEIIIPSDQTEAQMIVDEPNLQLKAEADEIQNQLRQRQIDLEKEQEKEKLKRERRLKIEQLELNAKNKKANYQEYLLKKQQEEEAKQKKMKKNKKSDSIAIEENNQQKTPKKRERRQPKQLSEQIPTQPDLVSQIPEQQLQSLPRRASTQDDPTIKATQIKVTSIQGSPSRATKIEPSDPSQTFSKQLIDFPQATSQTQDQILSREYSQSIDVPIESAAFKMKKASQHSIRQTDSLHVIDSNQVIDVPFEQKSQEIVDPSIQQQNVPKIQSGLDITNEVVSISKYQSQKKIQPVAKTQKLIKNSDSMDNSKQEEVKTQKKEQIVNSPSVELPLKIDQKSQKNQVKIPSPSKVVQITKDQIIKDQITKDLKLNEDKKKMREEITNQIYKVAEAQSYVDLLLSADCVFDVNIDIFKLAHIDKSLVVLPNIEKEEEKTVYREMYSWREEVLLVIPKLQTVRRDALPQVEEKSDDEVNQKQGKYKQKLTQSDSD